jgi:hypothetical protein
MIHLHIHSFIELLLFLAKLLFTTKKCVWFSAMVKEENLFCCCCANPRNPILCGTPISFEQNDKTQQQQENL